MAELDLVIDDRPTAPFAAPLDPFADEGSSKLALIAAAAGAVALGAAILFGRKIVGRPFATLVAVCFAWGAVAASANFAGQTTRHPGPLFARAPVVAPNPPETVRNEPTRVENPPRTASTTPVARDRRELVRDIQGELARRNHYQGALDGLTGPRTERAIRAAERELGLPETGQPSENLLERLRTPTRAATAPAASPASNAQVLSVQRRLADMGYAPGRIDGQLTPEFRRAIERFQRDQDLEATGRVDRAVVERLVRIAGPMS